MVQTIRYINKSNPPKHHNAILRVGQWCNAIVVVMMSFHDFLVFLRHCRQHRRAHVTCFNVIQKYSCTYLAKTAFFFNFANEECKVLHLIH